MIKATFRDSDLEALYKDSPADPEPVSYEDVLDAHSGSEADPADSVIGKQFVWSESYMKWSIIADLEYVYPSRQDNPWTGSRSHPTGKVLAAMPAGDWSCSKIEQMKLHLL